MKLNKKEASSMDVSSPLRRGNKIIMEGRGRKASESESGAGGQKAGQDQVWQEIGEKSRGPRD